MPQRYPRLAPGMVFGGWTVEALDLGPGGGVRNGVVRCSCGTVAHVPPYNLHRGYSTRCHGCAARRAAQTRMDRDGYEAVMPDPKLRRAWLGRIAAAIGRCTDPENPAWPNYGGRGIRVHAPWVADRALFLAYIAGLPLHTDLSRELDRVDNDRGYEPGNLRMATKREQMRNTRTNRGGGHEADCAWCGRRFLRAVWKRRYCGKPCAGRASHLRPGECGPTGQVRVE